jgi:tetraacyldisaccharide 4'-kinase
MEAGGGTLWARLARRLEAGDGALWARTAASFYAHVAARSVARPLDLPQGVRILGIGGAVLGGAGKTPLAIALTRALADLGEHPAFIGHAYRAHPGGPRVVHPRDEVAACGDDAIAAARTLASTNAAVIVAPTRQRAVDHAAALGHRVLVADNLLQAAPRRLHAAILTLDATAPWGAGACPPAGDLRAPVRALLAAADHVAAILPEGTTLSPVLAALGAIPIPSRIDGALAPDGAHLPLSALASLRVGLFLTVARPSRIVAALAALDLEPVTTICLADHAVPGPGDLAAAARARVDAWLTTVRCATKLPPRIGSAPVLALSQRLEVGGLLARIGGFPKGTDG